MATCSASTLVEAAKCFACLSKQQLQAVTAQLLCEINANGGGGGGSSATTGSLALGNGVENGSVTGLGLSFTPAVVLASVRKTAGGLNLNAYVVGTPTSVGFDFELSGITDTTSYILDYAIFP